MLRICLIAVLTLAAAPQVTATIEIGSVTAAVRDSLTVDGRSLQRTGALTRFAMPDSKFVVITATVIPKWDDGTKRIDISPDQVSVVDSGGGQAVFVGYYRQGALHARQSRIRIRKPSDWSNGLHRVRFHAVFAVPASTKSVSLHLADAVQEIALPAPSRSRQKDSLQIEVQEAGFIDDIRGSYSTREIYVETTIVRPGSRLLKVQVALTPLASKPEDPFGEFRWNTADISISTKSGSLIREALGEVINGVELVTNKNHTEFEGDAWKASQVVFVFVVPDDTDGYTVNFRGEGLAKGTIVR